MVLDNLLSAEAFFPPLLIFLFDGLHGVVMLCPPNSGVGEINIFRGNLDSAHAEKTRCGDSFSRVVCNGVMLDFLVTVV